MGRRILKEIYTLSKMLLMESSRSSSSSSQIEKEMVSEVVHAAALQICA